MPGAREYIKEFKPGQASLSAGHLNQLIGSARRSFVGVGGVRVAEGPDTVTISGADYTTRWVGKIDSTGQPSDYSDCRYFVKKQKITTADGDITSLPSWGAYNSPDDGVYTVVNLAEFDMYQQGHHGLRNETRVLVWETEDGNAAWRRVMSHAPDEINWGRPSGTSFTSGSDVLTARCDAAGNDDTRNNVRVFVQKSKAVLTLTTGTRLSSDTIFPFVQARESSDYFMVFDPVEVQTDTDYNTTTHQLMKKTRIAWVLAATESSDVEVTRASDCTAA